MANTFFDFGSLNNGENMLPPDEDDFLENEEEYDALNDETFGGLGDSSNLDDWEQQHEQFAEITESSRHTDLVDTSFSQLSLEQSESPLTLSSSVWSYTPPSQNDKKGDSFILTSLQKASRSFIESHTDSSAKSTTSLDSSSSSLLSSQPKKICTVEEIEKSLIKSSQNASKSDVHQEHHQMHQQQQLPKPLLPPPGHSFHSLLQHPLANTRLPPPGLPPMNIPPPGLSHLNHPMNHHPAMLPPGMLRLIPPHPQFMQANGPPRPPGFLYPPGSNQNQFPINHPFNFPPPHNINNMHANAAMHHRNYPNQMQNLQMQHQHHQQQQRVRHDSGGYRQHKDNQESRDEYAGLMSLREKQWLLNIQLIQLNTGTPYFDDYYFTVFKERKSRNNKENMNEKNLYHNKRQHRNSDRQENQNTMTPRVYTPLQFENSLGKLQCGSVTAPRKIIDMDIVTPDKDNENHQVSRDSRKTKQLLLELEAHYASLLKAEDINNPLYISNMEKLREMKQKQRLKELEMAPTPEQKQEVLRLFKLESEPIIENQYDYIMKIVYGLLQEEKFTSFLNIRKGKMLVLRLLPHLTIDVFPSQLLELWSKVLLSLPIVGRRDTAGDNILPKFYPFFKRFVQTCSMSDVLEIVSGLVEVVKQENNRSTPLSHVGKSPLYFVLMNKFGISALAMLLIRVEYLITSDSVSEKQQSNWCNYLTSWAKQTETVNKLAAPIELIPSQIFAKHCNRFDNLKADIKTVLEKHFVDTDSDV